MKSMVEKQKFEESWNKSYMKLGEAKFECRCEKCGRLLFRVIKDYAYTCVECKCSKCNHMNYIYL